MMCESGKKFSRLLCFGRSMCPKNRVVKINSDAKYWKFSIKMIHQNDVLLYFGFQFTLVKSIESRDCLHKQKNVLIFSKQFDANQCLCVYVRLQCEFVVVLVVCDTIMSEVNLNDRTKRKCDIAASRLCGITRHQYTCIIIVAFNKCVFDSTCIPHTGVCVCVCDLYSSQQKFTTTQYTNLKRAHTNTGAHTITNTHLHSHFVYDMVWNVPEIFRLNVRNNMREETETKETKAKERNAHTKR